MGASRRARKTRAGPQWGELNIGHLYQVLDRLKRDGLVTVVRAEPQPRRPDRLIYAITDAGREELERWLEVPSPPAAGYRDDLYLKLSAAARNGAAEQDAAQLAAAAEPSAAEPAIERARRQRAAGE